MQCMEHGVGVTRKELGNKEGKQKSRTLTVPWTEAGKSYIIFSKTGLRKEPLFESWHDLCLCLLCESFSNHLRLWDCDFIVLIPLINSMEVPRQEDSSASSMQP